MRTIEVRVVSANAFPVCIVCVRAHNALVCVCVCESVRKDEERVNGKRGTPCPFDLH